MKLFVIERGRTMMRYVLYSGFLVVAFTICMAGANPRPTVHETPPPNYVPSGKVTYLRHCATCHGVDAKGRGPLGLFLKTPPSDLTLLAKRHGGKFPYQYVSNVLEFGPGVTAHGSSDMPTWGRFLATSINKMKESYRRGSGVYATTSRHCRSPERRWQARR